MLKRREKGRLGCSMFGADKKLAGIEKHKTTLKEVENRRKKLQKLETFKLTSNLFAYHALEFYLYRIL